MRENNRQHMVNLNKNPTEKMLECRKAFLEKGRLRNYDEDRKQQQSEIMKRVHRDY